MPAEHRHRKAWILSAVFSEGSQRELKGWPRTVVQVLAVLLTLLEFFNVAYGAFDPWLQRSVFTGLVFCLLFLQYGFSKYSDRHRLTRVDTVLALLAGLAVIYFALNSERITTRWPLADPLTAGDIIFSTIIFLLALEVTRRAVGPALLIIVLFFLTYTFFGNLLPGGFSHRPMSWIRFLDQSIYTLDSLFGTPIGVVVNYVFLFVLFGTVLSEAGGGDFFYKLAVALAGKSPGGPAKVAVISSGLYGTISGSPTADVVATGTFTIPAMKKAGYPAVFAGAVEAVASTGGSIMPPVMGTAAFLMAEFTGIPYVQIALVAAFPALLYYLAVYLQVHHRAVRMGLRGLAASQIEPLGKVLRDNWIYLIPIGLLVGLLIKGLTPATVAAAATLVTIPISWLRREHRLTLRRLVLVCEEATVRSLTVAAATSAAGLVIGGIMFTGLGGKFTSLIFTASQGIPLLTLVLTMLVEILLGMGMPTPSVYVLAAVLAGPALLQAGFDLFPAHLFIVYFASMSAITPPVAVAAFAAAGIAQASAYKIGWQAVRLGIVAFVVPYMFVFGPALIMQGTPLEIAGAYVTATFGAIALACAVEGRFYRSLPAWQRLCLLAAGLLLIDPGLATDLPGLGLFILVWFSQRRLAAQDALPVLDSIQQV